MYVIIWTECYHVRSMLSCVFKCYHVRSCVIMLRYHAMLSCDVIMGHVYVIICTQCYHVGSMLSCGRNVIMWDELLSCGQNVIMWDEMSSCEMNYFHVG